MAADLVADPVPALAGFTRLLRDAGVRAGPDRLVDAVVALDLIDVGRREELRDGLRAVLVTRREDLAVFDAAFDIYWPTPHVGTTPGSVPGRSRPLPIDPAVVRAWRDRLGLPSPQLPREQRDAPTESSGYSASELLRGRDFGEMTWEELQQSRRLLAQAPWRVCQRRTRRLAADAAGRVELRRSVRAAARSGGELVRLARARPRPGRRRVVVLCDVSGSMERYSRQLLVFAHAVARREQVETFVFSTRLTRVTRLLRHRDVDLALAEAAARVHDLGGGTRIGEALHDFNRRWARRVLGHGAVVLLISDGWDRGDPAQLATELARLRRQCHRLIWLNPLLGAARYTPEARGMAAALPIVDDLVACHNLAALDELGRLLGALEATPARPGWRGTIELPLEAARVLDENA